MKLTFKAKAAIFGCILGFLPIAKLWIQYPVALTSEAKNAEVNNIDIKKKNELFESKQKEKVTLQNLQHE